MAETPQDYLRLIERVGLIERVADYEAIMEKCVFFVAVIQGLEDHAPIEDIDEDLQAGVLGLYNETRRFMVKHGGMKE